VSVLSELIATASAEDLDKLADALRSRLEAKQPARQDEWLRGAEAIAAYLNCPVSRVEKLSSAKRIPVEHEGRGLLGRKSRLDEWVREGGGKLP
jgi:hypothetical protein